MFYLLKILVGEGEEHYMYVLEISWALQLVTTVMPYLHVCYIHVITSTVIMAIA